MLHLPVMLQLPAMPCIAGAFGAAGAAATAAAGMVTALAEGAAAAIVVPTTAAVRHETEIVIAAECLTAEQAIRIALVKADIPVLLG
jgi:hypothetical protein